MSSEIQRVRWDDTAGLQELTGAVMANEEPGYQIDGVEEYSQLMMVFSGIREVVPAGTARFNSALNNKIKSWTTAPHIDNPGNGLIGLAIHHNISDRVEVQLGTASLAYNWRRSSYPGIDPRSVQNLRYGITVPGRLTVFSEGGVGVLRPTAHYFKRYDVNLPQRYARYTTLTTSGNRLHARWVARRAIAESKLYRAQLDEASLI